MFQLSSTQRRNLPLLGWIATVHPESGAVIVEHGSGVETGPDFVVEGVWDGEFTSAAFDRSPTFFGSGLKVTSGEVRVVPSSALVDRIVYCHDGDAVVLSNSLAILLGRIGGRLDPSANYKSVTFTLLKGIDEYDSSIPIQHPRIEGLRQLYFDSIIIDRHGISVAERHPVRCYGSYATYIDELQSVLAGIVANSSAPQRRFRLRRYGTTSSGYDSSAVTALLADAGLASAYTSKKSNSLIPRWISSQAAIDDGGEIARHFGFDPRYLEYPREIDEEYELLLLAPSAAAPELIFYPMLKEIAESGDGGVLFTGYHGDKVWDVKVSDHYVEPNIIRGDVSGLALTEARLRAGVIHVPVPFIHARSIRDIRAIGRSDEMRPWRLGNAYDRPVPRRILESAGVPRGWFGQRKKAVVQHYNFPMNRSLRRRFFSHISDSLGWSPVRIRFKDVADAVIFLGAATTERLSRPIRGKSVDTPTSYLWRDEIDFPYAVHTWALGELARNFGSDSG